MSLGVFDIAGQTVIITGASSGLGGSSCSGRSSALAPAQAVRPGGYTASKDAIEQLAREFARQWAPHGIRVNALSPDFFPIEMNAAMAAKPERLAAMLARIPLGRAGERQDPVGAAVSVASPAAQDITGHSLAVDDGMSARSP